MASSWRAAYLMCALFGAATAQPQFLSAAPSHLMLWNGRYVVDDGVNGNVSVAFDWEHTSVSFAVSGTGATVFMHANITLAAGHAARFSVFVNDYHAANIMAASGTADYLLAAALPSDVNNVTVLCSLEPGASGAARDSAQTPAIVGFSVAGGAFVPPTPANRRIDIIGDSITAGSMYDPLESVNGPLSLGTSCSPYTPVTGNSQAYNWATNMCRYFRANCTTIAWSGRGLIQNAICMPGPHLPVLYTQTFGSAATPAWDFASTSRPDAVIVYLGTNDYSCVNTTDAAFTAAYVQFMTNISAYYAASPSASGAPIRFFATIGPMAPTKPLSALQAAIAQGNAAGLNVTLLDMRANVTLDGCVGHPGPVGHWQMSLLAAPQIRSVMGW